MGEADFADVHVSRFDLEERLSFADADGAVTGGGAQERAEIAGDGGLEVEHLIDGVIAGAGQALVEELAEKQ